MAKHVALHVLVLLDGCYLILAHLVKLNVKAFGLLGDEAELVSADLDLLSEFVVLEFEVFVDTLEEHGLLPLVEHELVGVQVVHLLL